ncbi:MAG TPA: VOC family protein [Caulobacteraceae bacterium]|nr:VOC family protein [Caulobacteraceae bacterium]
MAQVLGLGGVFFKAEDPSAVRDWYARVLGVRFSEWGSADFSHPKVGGTVFSPFAADTKYFEPSTHPFMVNLIVDDLDGVLARAKGEGVEPLGREDQDYGRFAWLVDPAGVKVELWQPLGDPL